MSCGTDVNANIRIFDAIAAHFGDNLYTTYLHLCYCADLQLLARVAAAASGRRAGLIGGMA